MKSRDRTTKSLLFKLALSTVAIALVLVFTGVSRVAAVDLKPGDILVTDIGSRAIIRVDPATGEQKVVSSGGSLTFPTGIAVEASGQIVVVDGVQGVLRVDPTTGAQTVLSSGGFFVFPFGIAIEANGNILVADEDAFGGPGAIIRVDPVTGEQAQPPVSSGGFFAAPSGIAIEANGNVVVADQVSAVSPFNGDGGIIRVNPATGAQTPVSSGGRFGCPFAIAVEASGNILATTSPGCKASGVVRVNPSGDQIFFFGGGFFVNPAGIAVEANGNILVADTNAHAVILVDPGTGAQSLVSSGGGFVNPHGIAIVPPHCDAIVSGAVHVFSAGPRSLSSQDTSMKATFTPKFGLSLAAAAAACGVTDFNWQQKIFSLPSPSPFFAANNPLTPLTAPPSFNDPVPGGYTYSLQCDPGNFGMATAFPFYYAPQAPANNCFSLAAHKTTNTLSFFDAPADPLLLLTAGGFVGFTTQLVGMHHGNTLGPVLFEWTWMSTFNGTSGGVATINNDLPVDPDSGTGGVTILTVNGVPVCVPICAEFDAFTAKVEIELGSRIDDAFHLKASFTLGAHANRIDPPNEDIMLELKGETGSFITIIPAGSFKADKKGRFKFEGTINNVALEAKITPLGGNAFEFKAEGEHVNLAGIANTVTVTLTVGDDSGSTTVMAKLKDDHDKGEKDHDGRDRDTEHGDRD